MGSKRRRNGQPNSSRFFQPETSVLSFFSLLLFPLRRHLFVLLINSLVLIHAYINLANNLLEFYSLLFVIPFLFLGLHLFPFFLNLVRLCLEWRHGVYGHFSLYTFPTFISRFSRTLFLRSLLHFYYLTNSARFQGLHAKQPIIYRY